jgi:hypothetical protein
LGEYSARPGALSIPRSQRAATEIIAMGRPRKRLQTDQYDGRMFTTIPVTIGGRVSYHRIHLRTKDTDVARRRLTALDGVDHPDEAYGIWYWLGQDVSALPLTKKNGKLHRYWSVVESRRCGNGRPAQRPGHNLGEINDALPFGTPTRTFNTMRGVRQIWANNLRIKATNEIKLSTKTAKFCTMPSRQEISL